MGNDKAVSCRYQISHCILTLRHQKKKKKKTGVIVSEKISCLQNIIWDTFPQIAPLLPHIIELFTEYAEWVFRAQLSVTWCFTSASHCHFRRLLSFILAVERASCVNKHRGVQNKIQAGAAGEPNVGRDAVQLRALKFCCAYVFFPSSYSCSQISLILKKKS